VLSRRDPAQAGEKLELVDMESGAKVDGSDFATIRPLADCLDLRSPNSSVNQSAWCREVPALELRVIECTESCHPRGIGTDRP
jgi:hypothetical protein